MKVFDKIKDLFTDEVEVEEPVKKEVIQVEIPAPKNVKQVEEDIIMEKPVEKVKPEVKVQKKETVSPFFDEKDFEDIKRDTKVNLDEIYREERIPTREDRIPYREDKRPLYTPKKEETKKHFEPTPIISPIYGVLDKNYKKDDIVNKAETPKSNKDITLDDVRNKAYGTLEDELESTLFGRTAIIFQNNDKKEEIKDIEKDLDETAAAIDLLRDDIDVEPKHKKKDEELSLEDTMITALTEDETPESEEKMTEKDLLNLIDDMYEKGDN